jgi:uncharacterized membrane protein YgaE (UPF0421/DUF939 family)
MWRMKLSKLSAWDVAYAIDMAIACLITCWVMTSLLPRLVGWPSTSVGVLWAVISTVFVYKDTRTHSLSAGVSRLIATFASFALCLIYLSLLPATTIGMGALIAIGVLLMILIGRSEETGLTAITIAIIMIIAASNPQDAWLQPLLRLADTLVGIAVGVACKWVASFVFYRIFGEDYRGVGSSS